jgi:hypothetical protein
MALPRMTVCRKYVAAARLQDPETVISEHLIYGILKSGAVPHVCAGKRLLFNADTMDSFLSNGNTQPAAEETGKIRRIPA